MDSLLSPVEGVSPIPNPQFGRVVPKKICGAFVWLNPDQKSHNYTLTHPKKNDFSSCSSTRLSFFLGFYLRPEFGRNAVATPNAFVHAALARLCLGLVRLAKALTFNVTSSFRSSFFLMVSKWKNRWVFKKRNPVTSYPTFFGGMGCFQKIVGFPPKSSILIRFSIINHPFWGTSIFWKHPMVFWWSPKSEVMGVVTWYSGYNRQKGGWIR